MTRSNAEAHATDTSIALPAPSADEQGRQLQALVRYSKRRRPVVAKVSQNEAGEWSAGPAHSDGVGWAARLNDATGSAASSFGQTQLGHLTRVALANPETAESATNSMLAAVEAVRPEDEVEGMLAVQMAATHQAAMQCLGKACQGSTPQTVEALGGLANKLMRTWATQAETLAKLRRDGEQRVTVEHVHVYQGGQAIVGSVSTQSGSPRGVLENGSQPHAPTDPRALAVAFGDPVLRADPERPGVSVAGREGQGAVPDARRRQG